MRGWSRHAKMQKYKNTKMQKCKTDEVTICLMLMLVSEWFWWRRDVPPALKIGLINSGAAGSTIYRQLELGNSRKNSKPSNSMPSIHWQPNHLRNERQQAVDSDMDCLESSISAIIPLIHNCWETKWNLLLIYYFTGYISFNFYLNNSTTKI